MRIHFASFAVLAACSAAPPSPSTVRARISSDLGNVLHESKNASDGSTANLPGGTATGWLGVSTTTLARSVEPLRAMLEPRTAGQALTPPTQNWDPDATIMWLNDNLFTDANYLGDGVYKVPASLVCTVTTIDQNGNTIQTVDPDCAMRVETAQLRVRVEEDDNHALRFAIQVDSNHDEPLSFLLSHDEVAMTLDLDGADKAMIALAQAFGQQAPNASLSGQATADLMVLGAAHAKASLTVDRAIAIAVAPQGIALTDDAATRFATAAGQIIAIEADGNAPVLKLDLGIGETTAHLPGDATTQTPSTDVDLGGLTASAVYAGGNTLTVSNISLGNKTTTVAKNGVIGESIDLNPNDGRSFAMTLSADQQAGTETIAVTPLLDLHVAIDHAVLGDAPPVYDTTRVQLTGSLTGLVGDSTVKVATGAFSITTSPAQYGFSAVAGQCVTSTDTLDQTSSQYYTAYSVSACP